MYWFILIAGDISLINCFLFGLSCSYFSILKASVASDFSDKKIYFFILQKLLKIIFIFFIQTCSEEYWRYQFVGKCTSTFIIHCKWWIYVFSVILMNNRNIKFWMCTETNRNKKKSSLFLYILLFKLYIYRLLFRLLHNNLYKYLYRLLYRRLFRLLFKLLYIQFKSIGLFFWTFQIVKLNNIYYPKTEKNKHVDWILSSLFMFNLIHIKWNGKNIEKFNWQHLKTINSLKCFIRLSSKLDLTLSHFIFVCRCGGWHMNWDSCVTVTKEMLDPSEFVFWSAWGTKGSTQPCQAGRAGEEVPVFATKGSIFY